MQSLHTGLLSSLPGPKDFLNLLVELKLGVNTDLGSFGFPFSFPPPFFLVVFNVLGHHFSSYN